MKIVIDIPEKTNAHIRSDYGHEELALRNEDMGILCYAVYHGTPYEERPRGEWIPCSERLPEEDEDVLAWIERDAWKDGSDYPTRKQEFTIGWHIAGRWIFDGYAGNTKCIAWMPLPEPYKKEGDSDA